MSSEQDYEELRAAVDDIESGREDYYDRETLNLLLTLYARSRIPVPFTYEDRPTCYQETVPIGMRLLCNLADSMRWVRVMDYERNSGFTPTTEGADSGDLLNPPGVDARRHWSSRWFPDPIPLYSGMA